MSGSNELNTEQRRFYLVPTNPLEETVVEITGEELVTLFQHVVKDMSIDTEEEDSKSKVGSAHNTPMKFTSMISYGNGFTQHVVLVSNFIYSSEDGYVHPKQEHILKKKCKFVVNSIIRAASKEFDNYDSHLDQRGLNTTYAKLAYVSWRTRPMSEDSVEERNFIVDLVVSFPRVHCNASTLQHLGNNLKRNGPKCSYAEIPIHVNQDGCETVAHVPIGSTPFYGCSACSNLSSHRSCKKCKSKRHIVELEFHTPLFKVTADACNDYTSWTDSEAEYFMTQISHSTLSQTNREIDSKNYIKHQGRPTNAKSLSKKPSKNKRKCSMPPKLIEVYSNKSDTFKQFSEFILNALRTSPFYVNLKSIGGICIFDAWESRTVTWVGLPDRWGCVCHLGDQYVKEHGTPSVYLKISELPDSNGASLLVVCASGCGILLKTVVPYNDSRSIFALSYELSCHRLMDRRLYNQAVQNT